MLLSAAGPGMARPAAGVVTLSLLRVFLTAVLLLASLPSCSADPALVILYVPGKTLEDVDVALIDRAELKLSWPHMI